MGNKTHQMFSIDSDLSIKLKLKKMQDPSFVASSLINSALISYFEKENSDISIERRKVEEKIINLKSKKDLLEYEIINLKLQLTKIEEQTEKEQTEQMKLNSIMAETMTNNRTMIYGDDE